MTEGHTVHANGIEFAYLEEGSGPLVLLMHGFPDNAHTWDRQMPVLAEAGYRAVAPFIRGYPPTEIPGGGYYDVGTLATDVRALVETLGDGPAFIVGHDWSALITYAVCAAFPETVRRAVAMAVPVPRAVAHLMEIPEQVHHAFHWWFFQARGIPEVAVRANDFAFIDYLWRLWEPGLEDREHIADVKRMLAQPGALEAALGYYRAAMDPALADPAHESVRARLLDDISVPTLAIFGADDPRAEFAKSQAEHFTGEYRAEILEDCAHFLQRSRPDEVSRLIVEWLGEAT